MLSGAADPRPGAAPDAPDWPLLVIGAGPAGLAAAEVAAEAGVRALVVDRMPSVGRKFLMAGKSGLNLTFDAEAAAFLAAYPEGRAGLAPALAAFGPAAVRAWAAGLGQETFVGSSGRVFPRAMKGSPLLRAWLARLDALGVSRRVRWRWVGAAPTGRGWRARFETPEGPAEIHAATVVLALGGASWPRLGSDAAWVGALAERARVRPFAPSNMGVAIRWSPVFAERFAGAPLKDVALSVAGSRPRRGEAVVTAHGLEGSGIYALSPELRAAGAGPLTLDLAPGRDQAALAAALAKHGGKTSAANRLRKAARLTGVKAGLLREAGPPPADPAALAARIKALALPLAGLRPLAEAISSAGGVAWADLDAALMLRRAPGMFVAGEMIDWDAPTGGYLLTACIALGRMAGAGAAARLRDAAD